MNDKLFYNILISISKYDISKNSSFRTMLRNDKNYQKLLTSGIIYLSGDYYKINIDLYNKSLRKYKMKVLFYE